MKNSFDKLEASLQNIIENWSHFLPVGNLKNQLARQLVDSMKASMRKDKKGRIIAHHIYILHITKSQLSTAKLNQEILDVLSKTLLTAAQEEGISFTGKPMVTTRIYDSLNDPKGFNITSESLAISDESTAAITTEKLSNGKNNSHGLPKAFLLVNENEIHTFELPVINIGRREDNQIVIDDLHISRKHAQIRAVQGKYTIFDLGTTGGTFINGHRITQQELNPGDVISLAGVPMIYGEDSDPMDLIAQLNEEKTKKLSFDEPSESDKAFF